MDKKKTEGNINDSGNKGNASTEGAAITNKSQLIIVFLIGFLLGLLVGPLFVGDRGDVDLTDENTTLETTDGEEMSDEEVSNVVPETPGSNNVTASNQLPGQRVAIDSVTLSRSGWAVVHESIDGEPTNALGAQRFDAGEYDNAHVDLLRSTELGNTYFVILYADNGDGEFSLDDDAPLQEEGGRTISTTFETIQIDRKN